MPGFAHVALRWAVTWSIVGLVVGVLSLVRGFAFSVPVMILAAAAAGLAVGLIYTGLLALSAEWRDTLEGDDWKTRLGPYMICGAAAGLIPGFLVGGTTGSLFFGLLGGCTAGALTWIEMRKAPIA